MSRAGVELTPTMVRLVRVAPFTRRVTQSIEQPWDPSRPLDAIAALRAKAGPVQSISIAVGLGFLEVARVDLPPLSSAEQSRIVELEPDRYFATGTREALVATVTPDEPIAFGAPASLVASWLSALETWAPVDSIEPAPVAIARALGNDGATTYVTEAGSGDTGVIQLRDGRLVSVRRTLDPSVSSGKPAPVFVAARGAAMARNGTMPMLAPDEWRRKAATRRRTTLVLNAIVAAAAIIFAVWSVDRWRERTLTALDQRAVELESRAAAADTALRTLRSRENEARMLREAGTRADPLFALAAISAALPREANVLSARASGNEWQIDGTTQDASVLVPLLDRDARFDSVRFLSASSRYRDGSRSYETFSIALRVRAP